MSLKNQIINVVCEKIVFPGRSLCRCEDGLALFTDWLLPKETAEVLVIRDKKTYREGILKNIILKSKDRLKPKCSSFGICGGCYFQNLSYENQLTLKQEYLKELLSFTGLNISTILPSPSQWHYRNKMEFSFFNNNNNGSIDLGLHEKGNFNKYISVPSCYICDEDFIKVADIVKYFAKESKLFAYDNKKHEGFFRHLVLRKAQNNGQLLVNIVTNELTMGQDVLKPIVKELSVFVDSLYWTINSKKSDAVIANKLILLQGNSFIREKLNIGGEDFYFNISPFSFFQVNSKCTEVLYNQVLKLLRPSKHDTLLDLYCGTGTIGLSVAHSVKEIVGVDIIPEAIASAKENLIVNNINNAQFFVANCQDWVNTTEYKFDLIVVDPPRAGLTENIINFLLFSKSKRIVYISCNPSTLARDLQIIIGNGKYKLTEIVPVDVFVHTSHVEVVVALESN